MINIYKKVTDLILSKLHAGEIPWRKSWISLAPKNLLSKNTYQGMNFILLSLSDFPSQYYLTFKQCKDKGGHILKGSTGTPVIFWKMVDNRYDDGEIPFLRQSTVFNLSQTSLFEGQPEEAGELQTAQELLNSLTHIPQIKHNVSKAFYSPALDYISLPPLSQFGTESEYYSTLFHEIIHSTGHSKKLARFNTLGFEGKEELHAYSFEELVAELGSAFLCSMCGIDNTIENSAAYIQGWSKRLKADDKMILRASTKAKNAVNYLLNTSASKAEAA